MKTKLVKPNLSSFELSKLNFYADYLGYIFKFNREKQSALFETIEKEVAYIQMDEYNHLYLVWKSDERIEFIDEKINICIKLHKINIIPDIFSTVALIIGMHVMCGETVSKQKYNKLCLRTNNQLLMSF